MVLAAQLCSRGRAAAAFPGLCWLRPRPPCCACCACCAAQEAIQLDRQSPYAWCVMGNCFSLQKVGARPPSLRRRDEQFMVHSGKTFGALGVHLRGEEG